MTAAMNARPPPQPMVVVEYNMLANELAFGAVPWVMIVPESLKGRVKDWEGLRRRLTDEYSTHWHKNRSQGDAYRAFRRLWACQLPTEEAFLASGGRELRARWVGSDLLEYDAAGATAARSSTGASIAVRCETLHGLLRRLVVAADRGHAPGSRGDQGLAEQIFAHIKAEDEAVFDWRLRGRRIFDLVTNRGGAPAPRLLDPVKLQSGGGPDIVVLTEYDVHHTKHPNTPALDFLGDGVLHSFPEAMAAVGYHAVLFESPKQDGTGIGVFALADRFDLDEADLRHQGEADADARACLGCAKRGLSMEAQPRIVEVPPTSLDRIQGAASDSLGCPGLHSVDLHEVYHA